MFTHNIIEIQFVASLGSGRNTLKVLTADLQNENHFFLFLFYSNSKVNILMAKYCNKKHLQ